MPVSACAAAYVSGRQAGGAPDPGRLFGAGQRIADANADGVPRPHPFCSPAALGQGSSGGSSGFHFTVVQRNAANDVGGPAGGRTTRCRRGRRRRWPRGSSCRAASSWSCFACAPVPADVPIILSVHPAFRRFHASPSQTECLLLIGLLDACQTRCLLVCAGCQGLRCRVTPICDIPLSKLWLPSQPIARFFVQAHPICSSNML